MLDVLTGERLVRLIEWMSAIFAVGLSLGAWYFYSAPAARGVVFGAAIAIASFQVLKWQLKKAFRDPLNLPGKGKVFASYYLRFLVTLFLVFLVMYFGWGDPIAFLVGLSVIVVSIIIIGALEYLMLLARKGDN
ncbi:MAG: ATP synthase subunit I [Desulfobacteraceae bacterium]|nr:ATP synthase subunit I [Desulfobacteraceae bacterium]